MPQHSRSTTGLAHALNRAEGYRQLHGFRHWAQPGANLLDAYRITCAFKRSATIRCEHGTGPLNPSFVDLAANWTAS